MRRTQIADVDFQNIEKDVFLLFWELCEIWAHNSKYKESYDDF